MTSLLPDGSLLPQAAFICLSLNLIAGAVAVALQSDAFYDITGSATTILTMATALKYLSERQACAIGPYGLSESCTVGLLSIALVLLWTIRLGCLLGYRIYRMGHDSRFDTLKKDPVWFLIAWIAQGVWVFTITLPVTVLASTVGEGPTPVSVPAFASGALMWVLGMSIESAADWQKLQFRLSPENKGRFIDIGLFKYARYPQYFGEITLWTGMALLCSSALDTPASMATSAVSPVFTYCLLKFASGVPIQERQAQHRWGQSKEYQAYRSRTRVLLPWPRSQKARIE